MEYTSKFIPPWSRGTPTPVGIGYWRCGGGGWVGSSIIPTPLGWAGSSGLPKTTCWKKLMVWVHQTSKVIPGDVGRVAHCPPHVKPGNKETFRVNFPICKTNSYLLKWCPVAGKVNTVLLWCWFQLLVGDILESVLRYLLRPQLSKNITCNIKHWFPTPFLRLISLTVFLILVNGSASL